MNHRWTNSLGMVFVTLPAGEFAMGSPPSDGSRTSDERLHRVRLTQPFALGIYPVTVSEFRQFVTASGYRTQAEREGGALVWTGEEWRQSPEYSWLNPGFAITERHPVLAVSWYDAQAMVTWLNQVEPGRGYALPSESQWEYACRAGTQTAYWFGDEVQRLDEYAWWDGNSGEQGHPVGQKPANPWGLHDMHGLCWEWCSDWFGPYPVEEVSDPLGPAEGTAGRVRRGGSWYSTARHCRAGFRGGSNPNFLSSDFSFRLAALGERVQ